MVAQKNRKIENSGLKNRKNRKFRIKNRRKVGKTVVLSSTKVASLHLIRVIIKATSAQLLRPQDLDQLLRLRRSENYQYRSVYWLSYAVIRMILLDDRSSMVL